MIAKWIKFQILDTERQDWTRGYNTARQYFDREASLDVPYEHQEGTYPLGRWLSDQRRAFRAGTMSSTRADELDELGMIWDTADTAFAENLAAARAYYAQASTLAAPRHATASTNQSDNGSPTSADPTDSAKTPNAPHGAPNNSPPSTPTGTPECWGGPSTGNATGPA
ncbi:helicase associated domain-containing protein [Streptomyces sp. NPDC005969]|uniref:helicase associated domain-containing protein n=1 Tax=Streptomyces sp. NPDC005969 TaxID=3156722 RepID=UPI0033E484F8